MRPGTRTRWEEREGSPGEGSSGGRVWGQSGNPSWDEAVGGPGGPADQPGPCALAQEGSRVTFEGRKPSPKFARPDICKERWRPTVWTRKIPKKGQQGDARDWRKKRPKLLTFPGPQCRQPKQVTQSDHPPRTWKKVVPKELSWWFYISCKRLAIWLIQETVEMWSETPKTPIQEDSRTTTGRPTCCVIVIRQSRELVNYIEPYQKKEWAWKHGQPHTQNQETWRSTRGWYPHKLWWREQVEWPHRPQPYDQWTWNPMWLII